MHVTSMCAQVTLSALVDESRGKAAEMERKRDKLSGRKEAAKREQTQVEQSAKVELPPLHKEMHVITSIQSKIREFCPDPAAVKREKAEAKLASLEHQLKLKQKFKAEARAAARAAPPGARAAAAGDLAGLLAGIQA